MCCLGVLTLATSRLFSVPGCVGWSWLNSLVSKWKKFHLSLSTLLIVLTLALTITTGDKSIHSVFHTMRIPAQLFSLKSKMLDWMHIWIYMLQPYDNTYFLSQFTIKDGTCMIVVEKCSVKPQISSATLVRLCT